jgi:ferredoxin
VGHSTKTLTVLKYNDAKLDFVSEIKYNETQNLLDLLNAHKVGISQSCGGFASCTTCRIFVTNGLEYIKPREELEAERANERDFSLQERLACQIELPIDVDTDFEIIIANPSED